MQSQQPVVDSSIVPHSTSLTSIHVMDNSQFLTVGSGREEDPTHSHMVSHDPHPTVPVAPEGLVTSGPQGTHMQPTGQATVNSITSEISNLSVTEEQLSVSLHQDPNSAVTHSIILWQFSRPPKCIKTVSNLGDEISSTSFHHHPHLGSMFLAVGMKDNTVKIYNLPNFSVASELHFPEMKGTCLYVALNFSRESPIFSNTYFRNPFRDLILTTVWSDAKVMVCQVAKQ